jgi:glycine/D-amino acid oxidase-like deaminating enzyme
LRTQYGISPWVDRFPTSRIPDYPRLRGDHTFDVVIIGGGLTGSATAYLCAAGGLKTLVLEAERIGRGSSGRSAGLLLPEPGPAFRDVEQALGLRGARTAFESWRRATLDGAALLRRLNIKCGLEPVIPLIVADRDDEKLLRREFDARSKAGAEGTWLTRKLLEKLTVPEAPAGMRMRDAFTFDPYRACLGLAAAAAARRAVICENSPVTEGQVHRGNMWTSWSRAARFAHRRPIVTTGTATLEFRTASSPLQATRTLPGAHRADARGDSEAVGRA